MDLIRDSLNIPPEQRRLHTETYDFAVQTIFEKLVDESMFVPEFQRRYVWNDAQASRLIESLIIQCPIPVIYLNQEKDERLSVIDGNQRLISIKRFLNGDFELKGLTAYPELEGGSFNALDPRFRRHIMNRTLRCIVILKDTHPQVKFDVFERLNSGSVRLNPQELRHGLYFGDAVNLVSKIVKETDFLGLLEIKNDKRMKAEELVVRFLALHENFGQYKKPLAQFINNFVDERRSLPELEKQRLTELFQSTLDAVRKLFGELAFKIFDSDLRVESGFNAALYDAQMLSVAQLVTSKKLVHHDTKALQRRLAKLFSTDEGFRKSISVATSDEQQLRHRVKSLKLLLK